jgi:hypothetical protein
MKNIFQRVESPIAKEDEYRRFREMFVDAKGIHPQIAQDMQSQLSPTQVENLREILNSHRVNVKNGETQARRVLKVVSRKK